MRYRSMITPILAAGVALTALPGLAEPFLENGGGVRSGAEIGFDGSDDEFLAGGGGIDASPDIYSNDEAESFLEDGGGIEIRPDILSIDQQEEFLEDGGGFSDTEIAVPVPVPAYRGERVVVPPVIEPDRSVRAAEARRPVRHWRDAPRPRMRFTTRGSMIIATVVDAADQPRRAQGVAYRQEGDVGSFGFEADAEGPRIIDVESERLDRRPYPASGIDVIHRPGGPKIIRISPNF